MVASLDEEIWKWIIGYEDIYMASNLGRIKCLPRTWIVRCGGIRKRSEILMKPWINSNGYYFIGLMKDGKRKTIAVHILIAKLFIENPYNKPEVNHIDTDKSNNRADNLEWNTRLENAEHAVKSGRYRRKLSDDDVIFIRNNYKEKRYSQCELSKMFDVSPATICEIVNYKKRK